MKNRIIKFRAWDKENKLMEFVGAIDWTENQQIITCNTATQKHYSHQSEEWPDDFVLMQFTGLLDKNDKEIYEGDIVNRWYEKDGKRIDSMETVIFKNEWACFAFDGGRGEGREWHQMYSLSGSLPWEIKGNIYENPEMIT